MHIEKLSLFNFKNYEEATLTFSERVNCIVGENGSGKTNLLDAINYLSLTRSAFNTIDSQNILFNESFFTIKGDFVKEGREIQVLCSYQDESKKTVKIDKKEYQKLSEHVGKFPSVLIAPNDSDIIREGSEIRRKYFDGIICQIDTNYLQQLLDYNRILRQRNSALKKFGDTRRVDYMLLDIYDERLLPLMEKIYKRRVMFNQDFIPLFAKHYDELSEKKESVDINYKSDLLKEDFLSHYKDYRRKDIALERTNVGIHKDDYRFIIKNKALKKFGSQGQQKTFLVALKMAQFEVIKNYLGVKPILLLDDIFDKLDSSRIHHLMDRVVDETFGQVFITDARQERTKLILDELKIKANFYHVINGNINEE